MELLTNAIILTLLELACVFAEDNNKAITISYNPFQSFFNEHTLYAEWSKPNNQSFGIGIGLLYSNTKEEVKSNLFYPSYDTFPVNVYSGLSIRGLYSFYRSVFLFNTELLAKYMYYDNVFFSDGLSDSRIHYIRSEKSVLFGADFKLGLNLNIPISKNKTAIVLDPHLGVGLRLKNRNMNTHITYKSYSYDGNPPQEGHVNYNLFYFLPVIGFNIGYKFKY